MHDMVKPPPDPVKSDDLAQRERDAVLAAVDAVWQRLKWHKDEQLADREDTLSKDWEDKLAAELDDYVSRACNDVAELAIAKYRAALTPPAPTGTCACGWALVDAVDIKSGRCCVCRIKLNLQTLHAAAVAR